MSNPNCVNCGSVVPELIYTYQEPNGNYLYLCSEDCFDDYVRKDISTLWPLESVAYRRGRLMSSFIQPSSTWASPRSDDLVYTRPFGLNPYDVNSREYLDWNEGYKDGIRVSLMSA